MIRRTGQTCADARLDIHPSSAHVDHGEHLMRLPGRGEEVETRPKSAYSSSAILDFSDN